MGRIINFILPIAFQLNTLYNVFKNKEIRTKERSIICLNVESVAITLTKKRD